MTLPLHPTTAALLRDRTARNGTSMEREIAQALSEFLEVVEDQRGHDGYDPNLAEVERITTYIPKDLYAGADEAAGRMLVPMAHVVRFAVELKVGAAVRTESVVVGLD
jgi:hypothetical protein